jgi:hypothetical protein
LHPREESRVNAEEKIPQVKRPDRAVHRIKNPALDGLLAGGAVARILDDGRRQRTRIFSELQSRYLFADRFGQPGNGNDNLAF